MFKKEIIKKISLYGFLAQSGICSIITTDLGLDLANNTCFKKKDLNRVETVFEYGCYSFIVFSSFIAGLITPFSIILIYSLNSIEDSKKIKYENDEKNEKTLKNNIIKEKLIYEKINNLFKRNNEE